MALDAHARCAETNFDNLLTLITLLAPAVSSTPSLCRSQQKRLNSTRMVQCLQRSNTSYLDSSQAMDMQRASSAALAQQHSMHSMLRTSSVGGLKIGKGRHSGLRRQGSSAAPQESQGHLQSVLIPIQGRIRCYWTFYSRNCSVKK